MADEIVGSASITIELDEGRTGAQAERLGDRIERALARASRRAGQRIESNIAAALRRISPAEVRVDLIPDFTAFNASLRALNARNIPDVTVPVVPDIDRGRFEAAVRAALAGLEVSVRVVADLDDFDARIRRHRPPDITVRADVDTDRFTRSLASLNLTASAVGRVLSRSLLFSAIGIAAAGAVQSVLALTAALAPAAGAVAAIPAAAAGAGVALGTLKLATAGVGDAFKALASGDAKKLDKALKGLSPAAREAVRSVQELEPALRRTQQAIQNRFFEQFSKDIKGALTSLSPLGSSLQGVSAELGRAAGQALKFASSARTLSGARTVVEATRAALTGLTASVQPVARGFLDISAAVAQAFGAKLGSSLASAGASLGAFLTRLADSGRAVSLVQGAVDVFRQLGTIASNVGGILGSVFSAAGAASGGLLGSLERVTGELDRLLSSASGSAALSGFFTALNAAASQLGPILSAVATQLAALGPAVSRALSSIGPVIATLVNSLGSGLTSSLPLLESTFGDLVAVLRSLAPALPPVVASVAALAKSAADLLVPLAPLVTLLLQAVAPVVNLGAPLIVAAAGFAALVKGVQLALAVVPLIQAAWLALNEVFLASPIGVIAAAVIALAAAVFLLYQRFQPVRDVVDATGQALATAFTATLAFFQNLPALIGSGLSAVGSFFSGLPAQALAALSSLGSAVLSGLSAAGTAITSFLASLPDLVLSGLNALATAFVTGLAFSLGAIVSFGIAAVNFFIALPGRIVASLAALPGLLSAAFTAAASAASAVASSLVSTVTSFFASLPGRARAALSSLVGTLSSVFSSAKAAVVSVVTSLVSGAVDLVRSLPGRARAALGNLGSALASAGRQLVQGFINGITSAAGRVLSAARNLVDKAKSAFTAGLGIFSPSKVAKSYGEFVGQGFAEGITGSADQVKAAAEGLVEKIRQAFQGRKTRVDDDLIRLITASSKRLQALADQRDAIAAKIKQANELAASVTQNALQSFSLQDLFDPKKGVKGLQNGLDSAVKAVRTFSAQISDLASRGLRKDLLSQLIGLGPEQGGALATALAKATGEQIANLNDAQKALTQASQKLGQDSADELFDAGKQASQGFLAGLKAQQSDIERLMVSIAGSITKALKKALGIRSPSRVFAAVGRFTMAGLDRGLQEGLPGPLKTSQRAARALLDPFGGPVPSLSSGAFTRPSRASGSVPASRTVQNTFHITEAGDAEATASRVLTRMVAAVGL